MPINDLPGFYPEIKDGGLGALPALNVSVFGVIGVASQGVATPKLISDIPSLINEYESGSLVEQVLDAMTCGARQVVCLKAAASVADVVGTPTKTGTGTGTATADLQPDVDAVKCDRIHVFKITESGSLVTAKYKYSANNGITWSEEKSFVLTEAGKAKINLEDGTYIEFADALSLPEGSWVVDDVWVLANTEAKMNADDLADALEMLCAFKDANGVGLPMIYVAAPGDETVWAVLGSKAAEIWTNEQRPIWFVINSIAPDYTDIDGWLDDLVESSGAYRSRQVCINAFYGRLVDTRGNLQVRAGGGSIAGLIAKAKLHWSIGWVREMVLPNCVGIEPFNSDSDKMDDGRIAQLNDARFISARHWPGYGRVPTDDWMMAPDTSDIFCIRNRRIMDASINGVRLANTPFTNSPGVAKEDMIAYKKALEQPLDALKTEGALMDFTLTLTPDDHIWTNGIVWCTIEIVPTPTKKKLMATFQLKTGTAASV
jgi:hypothetical protein